MFAIVRTGGKQYRVAAGDKIAVDRMAGEAGDTVSLGEALFASDGGEVKSGLTVSAEIVAQAKADKIIVFKKKRRHNYRRKAGHRQQHTILKIVSVGEDKPVLSKAEASVKAAKKAEAQPAPSEVEPTQAAPVQAETAVSEAKPAKARKTAKPAIGSTEAAPGAIEASVADATTQEVSPEPAIPAGEAKKASAKKRAE